MKKPICLCIILILMLILAACGGSKAKSTYSNTKRMEAIMKTNTSKDYETQIQDNNTINTDRNIVELYPVNLWGKYRYVDKKGNLVLKPQFTSAEKFKEGMARVEYDGKFGFIDSAGVMVIKPQYMEAYDFSQGLAVVKTFDNKAMYIDKKGNKVISRADIMYPYAFSEGLAPCGDVNGVGFMDMSGNVAISPQYKSVSIFSEGLAAVIVGQKYGYIDSNGNMVIKPQFDYAQDFKEGMAGVLINNKYGFIDKTGRIIIQPQYDTVGKFSEGLASVSINNKWGFIDKSGMIIIGLNYEYVQDFSEGLAEANMKDKCYFIDKTGKPVITISRSGMYYPEPFNNGLAMVIDEEGNYYIDKSGNKVWKEPDSEEIGYGVRITKNLVRNNEGSLIIVYPQVEGLQDVNTMKKVNSILASDFNINYRTHEDETLTVKFNVQFIHGNILNIIENSYSYFKGAAHGNLGRISIIIDIKTGQSYTLEDLFNKDSKYMDRISELIKKQISEKQIPLTTEFKNIDTSESFYLDEDGIVIYFPPYKYTPYAAGFVEFKIKYSELDGIINKESTLWKSIN